MKWFKQLFCNCDKRNLVGYGKDKNNRAVSIWQCEQCGKLHLTFL